MGKKYYGRWRFVIPIVMFFAVVFFFEIKYFEIQSFHHFYDTSFLGITIDDVPATTFPRKESGYAIDRIICDKGSEGVWDYENWMLKVRNINQNRTKCQVNFVSKYTESILNGTDPVLKEGLIPVEISDHGTVTRAKLADEWYSYQDKKWANAVILTNEAKVYYEGEEIQESDIESYFVWIPRYKYQIFNEGNYNGLTSITDNRQQINVVFETKDVSTSNGSTVNSWLTHPAFTSFDVNGMWVGKFETGYKGATSTESAQVNANDSSKIQIKPNVYSWRNINVANAYLSSYAYKRELDSHMMKNTEWGAVAYLSHSVYGIQDSVRINNNEFYLTGYGAVNEPDIGYNEYTDYGTSREVTRPWNDLEYGVLASTTGNISGIYDMSGGAWEYVMAVMADQNGNPMSGRSYESHSGFVGVFGCPNCDGNTSETEYLSGVNFPPSKYYDLYLYGESDNDYTRRILGDATGELGPFQILKYGSQPREISSWYVDEGWFVNHMYPWFYRGAHYPHGLGAGIFSFHRTNGAESGAVTYRMVLSF